jgi:class 3 adenylate cyclase
MQTSALASQNTILPGAGLPARLDLVRELSGLEVDIIEEFAQFIGTGPEEYLFRTNPYRYAAATGLSERRALDLFLYATHAGILEFNWGMLCPGCAAFITSPGGLRSIQSETRCNMCQNMIEVSPDDGVEVAFTVSPSIRRIRFHSIDTIDVERDWMTMFYSTNRVIDPALRDHFKDFIIGFDRVTKDEDCISKFTLQPGLYIIDAPRHHASTRFQVDSASTVTEIAFDIFDGRIVPENTVIAAGEVTFHIRNRTGHSTVYGVTRDPKEHFGKLQTELMLPRKFTMHPYVTSKHVANSQVFRDLFRAESIPSDLGLAFKSVTFLFSDLKGSTALYERIGDIRAYQLVRAHFAMLRDIIAELGGSVVKTMGDAVMASFAEPLQALEAAILMNREISKLGLEEGLILKLGLHSGPCIAVESNERLDYFGQTVNIAARVQNAAHAGEIVITDTIFATPGAAEVLRSAALTAEPEQAMLRGIDRETTLYRLQ